MANNAKDKKEFTKGESSNKAPRNGANKKFRGKSQRNNNRGREYQERDERPDMKHPTAKNDASWYTYSLDIVNTSANLNYNNPIGIPYHVDPTDVGQGQMWTEAAPSLMSIYWMPTPGMAENTIVHRAINAPVNLQCRALYSLIQATVTQNLPFAAADLGIHLMFMDTIYLFMAHMQRFYYLYRSYKIMNRTMPDVFFEAYGMHRSSLHTGGYTIADFKEDLLTLEQELERIFVPEGFDILNRHYWMGKHVFKDSDSNKAQMYMFIPKYIWKFEGEGSLTGGQLTLTMVPSFYDTGLKGMMDFMHTMLDTYYTDSDVATLNGYLLRAFDKRWNPDPLDVNGILEPTFEPEVLLQIHNLRAVGEPLLPADAAPHDDTVGHIYQTDTDAIAWTPLTRMDTTSFGFAGGCRGETFLDMPMEAPTPADNLVATRLTVSGGSMIYDTKTKCFRPQAYGTELVTGVTVWAWDNAANSFRSKYLKTLAWSIYDDGTSGLEISQSLVQTLSYLSHFQFGPLFAFTNDGAHGSEDVNSDTWVDWLGDITNYTTIAKKDLMKLHDAAALGEWLIKG
jgi:hypothetical protein